MAIQIDNGNNKTITIAQFIQQGARSISAIKKQHSLHNTVHIQTTLHLKKFCRGNYTLLAMYISSMHLEAVSRLLKYDASGQSSQNSEGLAENALHLS